MGSRIYLTNLVSDVAGYNLALVDMRNPNLPTTPVSAITTATVSGTNIQMTNIATGGTVLKWITRKLANAVTLGGVTNEKVMVNMSARMSAGTVNAGAQLRLFQYTGATNTEQAVFLTDSYATAFATTQLPNIWATAAAPWTSTPAFVVGDRLVIKMYINNVGTMAAGTVTMDYDGLAGGDGDTYIELLEILQVSQAQIGSTFSVSVKRKGVSYFIDRANAIIGADPQLGGVLTGGTTAGGWLSDDSTQLAEYNEALNQAKLS